MTEVKKHEFWLEEADGLDYFAVKPEPSIVSEFIHVVSMSWHEQEMERMGAAYDGLSSRHRELMNDFNRVADAKSHLSSQVLEQQLKVDSLTAMLDKMEKALELDLNYLHWREDDLIGDDLIGDGRLTARYKKQILSITEALKDLADFRGSK